MSEVAIKAMLMRTFLFRLFVDSPSCSMTEGLWHYLPLLAVWGRVGGGAGKEMVVGVTASLRLWK